MLGWATASSADDVRDANAQVGQLDVCDNVEAPRIRFASQVRVREGSRPGEAQAVAVCVARVRSMLQRTIGQDSVCRDECASALK
jgi:hypothetical protein